MSVMQMARELGHDYARAVGNVMIGGNSDLFALSRLTIKRSNGKLAFQRVVHGNDIEEIYFADRKLTKGWATVRHTRKALASLLRAEQG